MNHIIEDLYYVVWNFKNIKHRGIIILGNSLNASVNRDFLINLFERQISQRIRTPYNTSFLWNMTQFPPPLYLINDSDKNWQIIQGAEKIGYLICNENGFSETDIPKTIRGKNLIVTIPEHWCSVMYFNYKISKKEIEDKFVPAFDPVKGLLVSGFPMPLFTTNGTLAVLTDMSKLESLYAGIERYKADLLLCEPFYVTLARNNVSKNICFVHRILGDSLSSAIIYKNVPLITSILPYRNKGNFIEETQEMNWLLSQGLKNSGANFEQIVKTTIYLDSRLTPPTEREREKYKTFNVEFKTISSYIKF